MVGKMVHAFWKMIHLPLGKWTIYLWKMDHLPLENGPFISGKWSIYVWKMVHLSLEKWSMHLWKMVRVCYGASRGQARPAWAWTSQGST